MNPVKWGTRLGMLGAIFVMFDVSIGANIVWMPGNLLLIWHCHKIKQPEQVRMFLFYLVVSVVGVVRYMWVQL